MNSKDALTHKDFGSRCSFRWLRLFRLNLELESILIVLSHESIRS